MESDQESEAPPEPPLSKLHFGLRIEAQAAIWYLENAPDSRLVARNFRYRGGEIDLIFEEPSSLWPGRIELVFVEVRARLPGAWVGGIESVQGVKLRRLKKGISLFLARYPSQRAYGVRLDLIAWDGTRWEHLKNAA